MGKSIKSECVIQILSHPQKYEQVLKFPTHILLAKSDSQMFSRCKRSGGRGGCVRVRGKEGANYLLITPVVLVWRLRSFFLLGPVVECKTKHTDSASNLSSFVFGGFQSAQQQANCLVGLLTAAELQNTTPRLWFLLLEFPSHNKGYLKEFQGISRSVLSHLPYGNQIWCGRKRTHRVLVNMEHEMWHRLLIKSQCKILLCKFYS